MNEKQMYEVRVLPLVKEVKRKGKTSLLVDNLTSDETKNMSCEPRMLWDFGDKIYFAEMPLTYRGSSVNDKLFYIYLDRYYSCLSPLKYMYRHKEKN